MHGSLAKEKRWDAVAYDRSFRFVAAYGESVVEDLAVEPGMRVLDLGCGTGELTARIAAAGATAVGLDRDPQMIARACQRYPGLSFVTADAHTFTRPPGMAPFDAVFSNAALHWMLRPDEVMARVHEALRPGGRFVAELGAHGNVAQVVRALQRVRAERGHPARLSPWFFPSVATYAGLLEDAGFEPRGFQLFDRPTPLHDSDSAMFDWLHMFASPYADDLTPEERDLVFQRTTERLRPALLHDGRWYVDYRRLRFTAVRPA